MPYLGVWGRVNQVLVSIAKGKVMREANAALDLINSSFYCSLSTINDQGEPHTSPIGSVYLTSAREGYFIEMFTTSFRNKAGKKACIMAVNTSMFYWLASIVRGRFKTPPATRLAVTIGERRAISDRERARFQKKVGLLKGLKGHTMMWTKMDFVRPFVIDAVKPVSIGAMTAEKKSGSA